MPSTKCKYDELSPEDEAKALDILVHMISAPTRQAEAARRSQLRAHAVYCMQLGACLNLSEQGTRIGEAMARANERARKMGWL